MSQALSSSNTSQAPINLIAIPEMSRMPASTAKMQKGEKSIIISIKMQQGPITMKQIVTLRKKPPLEMHRVLKIWQIIKILTIAQIAFLDS